MFAKIKKLYSGKESKFLADIQLFDGSEIKKVELPGPAYGKLGFQNGFKIPYSIGDKVLVGFIDGRIDNPVILQIYSYPGGSEAKLNLALDSKYSPEEVSIGHSSGHRVVFKGNKVVFYSKTDTALLTLNFLDDTLTLSGDLLIEGDMTVDGKLDVGDDITWNNNTVKTTASTHIHGTGVGPSASPNPGS